MDADVVVVGAGLAGLVALAVVVTSLASWLPGLWASRASAAVLLRAE